MIEIDAVKPGDLYQFTPAPSHKRKKRRDAQRQRGKKWVLEIWKQGEREHWLAKIGPNEWAYMVARQGSTVEFTRGS